MRRVAASVGAVTLLAGVLAQFAGDDVATCHLSAGQPQWIAGLDGPGATAREAVSHTLGAFQAIGYYTARRMGDGEDTDPRQTWVARQRGDASPLTGFTIAVTRTDDGYEAVPDSACD
jgi:hypothetical protein